MNDDLEPLRTYTIASRRFLESIGFEGSCRDPLAEFSEWLAFKLLGGKLAESRVQKGYDLTTADSRRVQVKYLSNPSPKWRNEHPIAFSDQCDDYALVFFEDFELVAMIVFPKETLQQICQALGKKHPNQQTTLQFTRVNFSAIMSRQSEFESLGVRCFVS